MDTRRFIKKGWNLPLAMVVLSALLTSAAQGQGSTLDVPGGYATIQAAIDAANPGDTVLVAPGTYPENLDFLGKAIEVRSSGGPAATTIDGGAAGSVVTFDSGEGRDSILEGFTITNGAGTLISTPNGPAVGGGGILCQGASPTIRGNIVTGNSISGGPDPAGGGGIGCIVGAHPLIVGNEIHGNTLVNGAFGGGGGILCYVSSSPVITENSIHDNSAGVGAPGGWGGGGIGSSGGAATITRNTIYRNTSQFGGGIQVLQDSVAIVEYNAIFDNTALIDGGGIDCASLASPVRFANNTVYGNSAQNQGGGMRCASSTSVSMSDTIFWNNAAATGMELALAYASTLDIQYSDVQGGQGPVHVEPASTLNWGAGMIDADPLFIDPANGDFRLQQDPCQPGVANPCVDSGDPSSPMVIGTTRTDLVQDAGVVDMGFHYDIASIPGIPYCSGDPGSGTPCPCSNDNDGSVPGCGCANGAFASGARLVGSGVASVVADSLVLTATGLDPNNTGLYFQANNAVNNGDGNPFGDGLRCADGGLIRLQIRTSDAAGFSSTTIAIAAKGGVSAGDTKRYQCWYRDNSGSQPCGVGVNNFNLSNGYEITWLP